MAALTVENRRTLTLIATILGSSLAFIDATVVIVALPTIEEDLDLGLAGQEWVFLAYSLALAALYLPAGAIGDRYGRRNVFIAGAAGFALTSVLAGAAPDATTLIVARLLQGVAGAFLTTNSLALLRGVYGDQAGRAVGLWTAFTSVATLLGPPAGGALVQWASWRWIFFLNLPLAAATVALAHFGRCDEKAQLRVGRLDIPGAVLAATGFGALTYGLVEGTRAGFADHAWAFGVAAVALAAFVLYERRAKEPMLPFDLFKRRNFAAANLETFIVYAALYGNFVFFTIFLQFLGFSPFEAGLIQVPTSLVLFALAARFGALADRHGPRLYLTLGPALFGFGTLCTLLISEKSDFWTAGLASLVLTSVGLAMLVAPITATALKSAPSHYAGIASGVNSTVSRLGSTLAIAIIGLLIALVFDARTDEKDAVPLAKDQQSAELRDASIDAFRVGMVVVAGLAFVGAAVGAAGISNEDARLVPDELSGQAPAPAGS